MLTATVLGTHSTTLYAYAHPVSPLALDLQTFPKVVVALDTSLASSDALFAVHALASDRTIFLKGTDIAAYLRKLECGDAKIHEIDFDALRAEAAAGAAPATAAPAQAPANANAPRDDGRIEGDVQIAIGLKKEVNFADWYTNVRFSIPFCTIV